MKKTIKTILFILWLLFIFYMSSQNGSTSRELSDGLVNDLLGDSLLNSLSTGIFSSWIEKIGIRRFIRILQYVIRKVAHFTEFLILYILAHECFKEHSLKKHVLLSLLLCFVYAGFDEFHQTFVDGRTAMWEDWLIDAAGSTCGFLLWHKLFKR